MSVIAQRKLITALREIRKGRSLTQDVVARDMEWSLSKVIRIENGSVKVSVSDLRSLLAYYGVQDGVEELLALARGAKASATGWWKRFEGRVPTEIVNLAAHEAEATRIWSFEPLVIPGLLQTEAYAEAVSFTPADVAFRLARRAEVLKRGTEMTFIVDEAVLYRSPDTERSTLADQLECILDDIRLPNVSVRVLALTAGAHSGWSGSYTIVDCDGQRLLVTANGFQATEDTDKISLAEDAFKDLIRRANSPERSAAMINDVIDGLRA